jgi:hypothetical protein
VNRRPFLADHAQGDAADQIGPHLLGRVQRLFGLLPGGAVRTQQHDAAEHRGYRGDKGGRIERQDREQRQREPEGAAGDGDLGADGNLAAALDRFPQRLDAGFEAGNPVGDIAFLHRASLAPPQSGFLFL